LGVVEEDTHRVLDPAGVLFPKKTVQIGFHSLANFCASAIWADAIFDSILDWFARANQICLNKNGRLTDIL